MDSQAPPHSEPPQRDIQQCLTEAVERLEDPTIEPILQRVREIYQTFGDTQKRSLFEHLATELEADLKAIQPAAIPADLGDPKAVDRLIELREKIESPRQRLLRQFVNIPGGIKFLVDLRADLLDIMKRPGAPASLRLVETDLLHLFRSWFNHGFLRLVPITWETTSAGQLEKLMAHDTVHPIHDWADLRRRLQRDRLCYAFYHPNMPDEPLIFVAIALTRTVASSIDQIIRPDTRVDHVEDATTAIFYSINSTQRGLRGVSLGNSLIKTVVGELQRRYGWLKRFSTLSPMPAFRGYLELILGGKQKDKPFTLTRAKLAEFFTPADAQAITTATGQDDLVDALGKALANDGWVSDAALRLALKPGLLRIAHHYLTQERRGDDPYDPVANFHLHNGALIYNLNFLSDSSPKGMSESYGLTANYRYDPGRIDEHQRMLRGGQCPVSPQLEKMLSLGTSA